MTYSRPDWIMIGISRGVEVTIFASTEISEAELLSEVMNERDLYFDSGRSPYYERSGMPPIYRHTITATMLHFVEVTAPTYAEALHSLLTFWTPERAPDSPRPGIAGSGRPQIDGPS